LNQKTEYCGTDKPYGKSEPVADTFQAFLVEGASFTDGEEYPIIPCGFVSPEIPKYIMPFQKAIHYRGDLSETFICTYSPDETFERIRRNPKRYTDFFRRTGGLIGFDFSIHTDMTLIKQKTQMNDNLSLTYYYGAQGNKVIPNIRCGVDELLPEFLSAIPRNTLIAVGTHGFIKYKYEKYEWYCFLETVLKELEPSGVVVYGSLRDAVFDELKRSTAFYCYEPWITNHRKG
jgi:hypothetical protein